METEEKLVLSNSLGSITDKRIILNYKSGTEDIPINHISSISYRHKRNYFSAIGSFLICGVGLIGMLANIGYLGGLEVLIILLFIIIFLLSGIANWVGHHNIVISTAGKDREPLKAELAKFKEGRAFVDAAKQVIMK